MGVIWVFMYNMSYIVQQGALNGKPVLGVSINYRMAAFGFLDSKEVRVSCFSTLLFFSVIDSTGRREYQSCPERSTHGYALGEEAYRGIWR